MEMMRYFYITNQMWSI